MSSAPPIAPWGPPVDPPGNPSSGRHPWRWILLTLFVIVAVAVAITVRVITTKAADGLTHRFDGTNPAQSEYQPVTGPGFQVLLPGRAERKDEPVPGQNFSQIQYLVTQPRVAYLFAYFDLPAGTTFDLNKGAAGMASGAGGKLVSTSPTTVGGYPAVDTVSTASDDEGNRGSGFNTVVLAGKRVYLISTIVDGADQPMPAGHRKVRESLKLTGTPAAGTVTPQRA